METNPIGVCELLVGLPDVTVLGVDGTGTGEAPLRVHVQTRGVEPLCVGCAATVRVKDRDQVSWWIWRCLGARHVWCGTNGGGCAKTSRVGWGRSPSRHPRSRRRGRR